MLDAELVAENDVSHVGAACDFCGDKARCGRGCKRCVRLARGRRVGVQLTRTRVDCPGLGAARHRGSRGWMDPGESEPGLSGRSPLSAPQPVAVSRLGGGVCVARRVGPERPGWCQCHDGWGHDAGFAVLAGQRGSGVCRGHVRAWSTPEPGTRSCTTGSRPRRPILGVAVDLPQPDRIFPLRWPRRQALLPASRAATIGTRPCRWSWMSRSCPRSRGLANGHPSRGPGAAPSAPGG